jgi:hypothetical protein
MLKTGMIATALISAIVIGGVAASKGRSHAPTLSPIELYRLHRFPSVGTCYVTTVKRVTSRFGGEPSRQDGTAVTFANGLGQVSYEFVPEVTRSRLGDKVTSCVVSLPQNCPPGDTRGIYYRTRDWRTGEHWTLPDSQHQCGGA